MNKIKGYRNMVGLSQKKMASLLGISEGQYRAKEKGRYDFSKSEMKLFHKAIQSTIKDVSIESIFF